MNALTLAQATTVIFAALLTSVAALIVISRLRVVTHQPVEAPAPPEIVFLFDGEKLVDASPAAYRLLGVTPARESDIARLVSFLAPRFPDLHDVVMGSNELDALDIVSSDGRTRLRVGVGGGRMRLRLDDTAVDSGPNPDRHTLYALTDELTTHRQIENSLPVPVWRQTQDDQIIWANAAYLDVARQVDPDIGTQKLPADVFGLTGPAALVADNAHRVKIDIKGTDDTCWYDCTAHAIGSDVLFIALPADRILRAEGKLRDFVNTLTQTFAHLNVGLAIFDRKRRLTLFNPALTDLLGLPPEYLISHPSLPQFLDQLRERRMMPEPKDYKTWRAQMSALEAAAEDGSYSETWALSDGRTYRVTGRPHPEGAVAFLFEDISAEISLTRRFRSELETGQAVIDSLDEAIAVFSPAGYLMMSNRVYADLWDFDPSTSLTENTFLDATRRWQQNCTPTPVWGDARDFAATIGERSNWTAEVRLQDGRQLCCRFESLPGGATMAAFAEPLMTGLSLSQSRLEPARA